MPGMYRIGPSDFFTNEDLKADALTLNSQIDLLDDQPFEKVTEEWFDAWMAFRSEWKRFYSGTILGGIFGPAWNNGNRDQLIQFEERFKVWAAEYAVQVGGSLPGGIVVPSTGTKDTFGDHLLKQIEPLVKPLAVVADSYKWYLIGGAALVALIVYRQPIMTGLRALRR